MSTSKIMITVKFHSFQTGMATKVASTTTQCWQNDYRTCHCIMRSMQSKANHFCVHGLTFTAYHCHVLEKGYCFSTSVVLPALLLISSRLPLHVNSSGLSTVFIQDVVVWTQQRGWHCFSHRKQDHLCPMAAVSLWWDDNMYVQILMFCICLQWLSTALLYILEHLTEVGLHWQRKRKIQAVINTDF